MTVIRPVRPTDLVALVSFDGRIYPNEAKSCERLGTTESAPHPIESAIEQWFSFATGRHTWISVKGATLRGLLSARRRASRRVWEVDCLINAAEDDDAVCLGLLDQAVAEAARSGVEKVFLRLCSDSPVVPIARKAGFLEYVTEQLLFSRAPRFDFQRADGEGRLRKRTRGDDFPLFQLYNAVVPEPVRRAEALTLAEWKANQDRKWLGARIRHHVLENDGQLTAWVRSAVNGENARFDMMVRPEQPKAQEALLDLTLARLAPRGALMTLLPRYADGLRRSLLRRGFQQAQEYRLLVKRTTVAVKAAQLAPAI